MCSPPRCTIVHLGGKNEIVPPLKIRGVRGVMKLAVDDNPTHPPLILRGGDKRRQLTGWGVVIGLRVFVLLLEIFRED